MPSLLALLLCAGFIGWLLSQEQKLSGQSSRALWVPTLWMLYFASKPVGRWLNPQGEIEDSAADRLFLLVLIALGSTILTRRKFACGAKLRQNQWLVLLVGYMLVSCIWSLNAFSSFKQWIRVFGSCIMAFVVLTEAEPKLALQSMLARATYILIPLSVVLVKYFPDLGVEYRAWNGEKFWVGASMQKNGLARLCMVCSLFVCWRLFVNWKHGRSHGWKRETYANVLMLVIIAWLLKGPEDNYPMTAIVVVVGCVAMIGLLFKLKSSASRKLHNTLAGATLVMGLVMAFVVITGDIPSFGVKSMGRDATFTGRTYIWDGLRKVAWGSPILGVGYSGYWNKHHEFPTVGIVNEGHNGYLDVFVETGGVGLGLMFMVIISFIRKVNRERKFDPAWASLRIVFLLMLVFHNFTETSFMRSSTHLWCLFIYLYVVFEKPKPVPQGAHAPHGGDDHDEHRSDDVSALRVECLEYGGLAIKSRHAGEQFAVT